MSNTIFGRSWDKVAEALDLLENFEEVPEHFKLAKKELAYKLAEKRLVDAMRSMTIAEQALRNG